MKILVIEDDAIVTETLTLYLEQAGYSVVSATSGPAGLAMAADPDVALIILDLMIPGMSGQDVCRRVRAGSTVPIIMLTARASEDDRIAGLELGADDYVTKPFGPREVVARVQALLRRVAPSTDGAAAPTALAIGALEIDAWSHTARVAGRDVALTPTEFKLLETLGHAPGRVFTREELLSRAFGPGYDGIDRTVDVHITNLRRKLEAHGTPRCVHTVHGVGYRLTRPDGD